MVALFTALPMLASTRFRPDASPTHLNHRVHTLHGERKIDRDGLIHQQLGTLLLASKPISLRRNRIESGGQLLELVLALGVRVVRVYKTILRIFQQYLRVGDRCTRGISDHSTQRGHGTLRGQGRGVCEQQ